MFKSVIFSAISLSWCVASGLTGRPALGEHELVQGLSLSSPLISAHHLHPGRFMERIKESRGREDGKGEGGGRRGGEEARRSTRIPPLPNVEGRPPSPHSCDRHSRIHRRHLTEKTSPRVTGTSMREEESEERIPVPVATAVSVRNRRCR